MEETDIEKRIKKQKEEAERRKQDQLNAGGSAPLTPLGVAGLGSTPDQAKMAGTPAALEGMQADLGMGPQGPQEEPTTLQQASEQQQQDAGIPQDESLQTELGEKTFDDASRDKAEEEAAAFSEKMQVFGSLGQRVENMVTEAFDGLKADGEQTNLAFDKGFKLDDEKLSELAADTSTPAKVKEVLTEFSKRAQATDDIQGALDYLADNSGVFNNPDSAIMTIINQAYKKDESQLNSTVATLIAEDIIDPDQVNFDELIKSGFVNVKDGLIEELGITESELQDILGDNWKQMTPDQIGEEVESKREAVLANRESIEEQLADPNLPPQTRAALLDELKRMGAIGAVQYEQRAREAQQQAADSGKIIIGGEVKNVTELLKDDTIKESVVSYLEDPESDKNREWAANNLEFSKWLDREKATLGTTKENLDRAMNIMEDIQKTNEAFIDNNLGDTGANLKKEVMEALGFGGFTSKEHKASDNAVYNMLTKLNSDQIGKAANIINNEIPPEQRAYLKDLDADKLKSLLTNPDKMQEFATVAKLKNEWATVKNSNNVDKMADMLLGGGSLNRSLTGAEAVKKQMSDLFVKMQLGGSAEDKAQYELMKSVFDQDGNGLIDDPATVKSAIQNLINKEGNLDQIVGSDLTGDIAKLRNQKPSGSVGGVYDLIKGHIGAGDVTVSDEDLDKIYESGASIGVLSQLTDDRLESLGINKEKVNQLLRLKAKENVDAVSNIGLSSFSDFNAANSSDIPEQVEDFKKTRARLEELAENGLASEKAEAKKRLGELAFNTTLSKYLEWPNVAYASRIMSGFKKLDSVPDVLKDVMTNSPRFPGDTSPGFRFSAIDSGGNNAAIQNIVQKWATWRNYAKDETDMNEFVKALEGKW